MANSVNKGGRPRKRVLFGDFDIKEVAILDNEEEVILLEISIPKKLFVKVSYVNNPSVLTDEWVETSRITKKQ